MQHCFVLVVVPSLLCCKAVNAKHDRRQVFFGFLVVDTIPYVITGTCSTEHNVGLIFCCWCLFHLPFFSPLENHHSLYGDEIATVMESMWCYFSVVKGCTSKWKPNFVLVDDKIWQWFLFLCTKWYIFICSLESELQYGRDYQEFAVSRRHNGSFLVALGSQHSIHSWHIMEKTTCYISNNNIETYIIHSMVISWCYLLYCLTPTQNNELTFRDNDRLQ